MSPFLGLVNNIHYRFTFGHWGPILQDDIGLGLDQLPPFPHQIGADQEPLPCGDRLPDPDLDLRRDTIHPVKEGGIAHCLIEEGFDDAPMDDARPALVAFFGGELRLDRVSVPTKAELEPHGVFLTAGEAHGITFHRL